MIFLLSDSHVPERMPELPPKLLDKIKSDDIIFSAIGGSVFRHAGDFVRWEVYQLLQNLATLHAVCGNMARSFSATYGVLTIEGNDVWGDIFEVK
jgi:predicted phosphodiesterase